MIILWDDSDTDNLRRKKLAGFKDIEILLIDDNPSDVELALRALGKYNLVNKVTVLEDGAKALDYIFATGEYSGKTFNSNPKLILLDLKLPKVDGLEVLQRIKSDARTSTIPVFVLTSSTEERDIVQSYELAVNGYIVKPIDFKKLFKALSETNLY
jgi:CheY-like chemotaxis protein